MREQPSHPPRPGIRRRVTDITLQTLERRREFAAVVATIQACGLAAEIAIDYHGDGEPRFAIYATRRMRTTRNET